jgi:hypothetical protein
MAHRIRRHRSRVPGGFVASAAAAAVVLAVLARHPSIAAAAPGKAQCRGVKGRWRLSRIPGGVSPSVCSGHGAGL